MAALLALWLSAAPASAGAFDVSKSTQTLTEVILRARPRLEEVQRLSCLAAERRGLPPELASLQSVDPARLDEAFLSRYYDNGAAAVDAWPDPEKLVAAADALPRRVKRNSQGRVVLRVSRAEQRRIASIAVPIAIDHGLDPGLVLSFIGQESGFDRKARGNLGEIGLLQIMPETAAAVLRREDPKLKLTPKKLARILEDPAQNVRIGAVVLVELSEHLSPLAEKRHIDMKKVLAAGHNAGEHNVKVTMARYKRTPKATRKYEKELLAKYTRLKKQVKKLDETRVD